MTKQSETSSPQSALESGAFRLPHRTCVTMYVALVNSAKEAAMTIIRHKWYIPLFVTLWRKQCKYIAKHGGVMQQFVDQFFPAESAAFAAGLAAAQAFCNVLDVIYPPPQP